VLPALCLLAAHMAIAAGFPPAMLATLDLVVGEARLRIVPFGAAEAALARAAFDRTAGLGDCVAEAAALATGVALLDAGDAR
jgi:uncharacterized protein with PIN domain